MNDTRLVQAKEGLYAALVELDQDPPNVGRVVALLDDARGDIVDVVEDGLGTVSKADLNQLDTARVFVNRAVSLLSKEWAFSTAQQFIGHALDYLQVVLSGNVIPLRTSRTTPGGAA